jgi:hypothetical protein
MVVSFSKEAANRRARNGVLPSHIGSSGTGVWIPHPRKRVETRADQATYTPPKVWTWDKENGGAFAKLNRPIAGPTHEKELPVGRHPLQLYSLPTPNGVKVTVMLEELLALGHTGAEYDAWLIKITEGEQFGTGFVRVNPNPPWSRARLPARPVLSRGPPSRSRPGRYRARSRRRGPEHPTYRRGMADREAGCRARR